MEFLELKTGSIEVNSIETYNGLKSKLDFIKRRLNCVTSTRFKNGFIKIGDCSTCSCENKDYLILAANRSDTDEKLKQEIIDFLAIKFMEQIHEVISQMNELIE